MSIDASQDLAGREVIDVKKFERVLRIRSGAKGSFRNEAFRMNEVADWSRPGKNGRSTRGWLKRRTRVGRKRMDRRACSWKSESRHLLVWKGEDGKGMGWGEERRRRRRRWRMENEGKTGAKPNLEGKKRGQCLVPKVNSAGTVGQRLGLVIFGANCWF